MTKVESFGGDWTEDKLERLSKYLRAYTKIFDKNVKAQYLRTIYVDAFASTGSRATSLKEGDQSETDEEAQSFLKGSAQIALEVEPRFNQYLFIEKDKQRAAELELLTASHPQAAASIQVVNADANQYLQRWCATTDWSVNRAVVFLDPFGMQVEWALLEAIAKTQAIDVWLLFPIGMGVNRLLTKSKPPPPAWAARLTKTLGTEEWKDEFYPPKVEPTLFGDVESEAKDTDFDRIAAYFVKRLQTIYPGVANNPLLLRNSRSAPMYLLCFATASKKESVINAARRIAQHVLGKAR